MGGAAVKDGPWSQDMHMLPCHPAFPGHNLSGTPLASTHSHLRYLRRRLLWAGLLLFLAACSYIGYKRAPLVVRAPLDMALGTATSSVAGLWRKVGPSGRVEEDVGPA